MRLFFNRAAAGGFLFGKAADKRSGKCQRRGVGLVRDRLPLAVAQGQSRASESAPQRDTAVDDHRVSEGVHKGTLGRVRFPDEGVAGGSRGRFQSAILWK